jgi:hypothetical protein
MRELCDISWSLLELQPNQELKKAYIYRLCGPFALTRRLFLGYTF